MTWDRRAAALAMERVGLDPGAFDLDDVVTDLEARTAMNESLAAVIADGRGLEPSTVFDPRWPA